MRCMATIQLQLRSLGASSEPRARGAEISDFTAWLCQCILKDDRRAIVQRDCVDVRAAPTRLDVEMLNVQSRLLGSHRKAVASICYLRSILRTAPSRAPESA